MFSKVFLSLLILSVVFAVESRTLLQFRPEMSGGGNNNGYNVNIGVPVNNGNTIIRGGASGSWDRAPNNVNVGVGHRFPNGVEVNAGASGGRGGINGGSIGVRIPFGK